MNLYIFVEKLPIQVPMKKMKKNTIPYLMKDNKFIIYVFLLFLFV